MVRVIAAIACLLSSSFLHAQELLPVATDTMLNEYLGSAYTRPNGDVCVIFSGYEDFSQPAARLRETCSQNLRFDSSSPILPELDAMTYVDNGRVISADGRINLYFNAYDGKTDQGYWGRSELVGGRFSNPTWLRTSENLSGQRRPWIYPYVLDSRRYLLSYKVHELAIKKPPFDVEAKCKHALNGIQCGDIDRLHWSGVKPPLIRADSVRRNRTGE